MKKLLICLLILRLTSSRTWADSGPDQDHIDSVKKKVAECVDHQRRVVVETFDDRRLQGFISEAGTDDFVLSHGARAITVAYRDVKKIKWPSPAWKEVKVVAGAAALVGAIFGLVVLIGGLRG